MSSINSSKASRKKSKVYYYFFYNKTDGKLYAYTDNRVYAYSFLCTRKSEIYVYKKFSIKDIDLKELHNNFSGCLLTTYKFEVLNNRFMEFIITMNEKLNLEHRVNQALLCDIYCAASIIPIDVFDKNLQKALKNVLYDFFQRGYKNGLSNIELNQIKGDYLKCFLYMYGDTLNERWWSI